MVHGYLHGRRNKVEHLDHLSRHDGAQYQGHRRAALYLMIEVTNPPGYHKDYILMLLFLLRVSNT